MDFCHSGLRIAIELVVRIRKCPSKSEYISMVDKGLKRRFKKPFQTKIFLNCWSKLKLTEICIDHIFHNMKNLQFWGWKMSAAYGIKSVV